MNRTDWCRGSSTAAALALFAALLVGACTESASTVAAGPDSAAKCGLTTTAPPALAADGGNATISITTQPECAWTASTAANWISGFTPASSQGSGTLSFRVAPNDGTSAREADIAVNDSTVRISQRAPCRFDVSPASQGIGSTGGDSSVTVATANDCSWTAVADVSWLSVATPASGSGNGTVRFAVAPNSGTERSGGIAIGNQRAMVHQASAGSSTCVNSVSPTSQNIAAAGGAGNVAVSAQSGCQWTASSGASWITITSGAAGAGNGSVAFTVAANSGASRTGTIAIAGRTFTVAQAAAPSPPPTPCSYSIEPNSLKIDPGGGTATISVTTGSTCAWTAVSNASWITVTAGASGTGNGTVTISAPRNDGKDRKGTLTIAGKTATVEQKER